jgi:hypothetical protein
LYARINPNVLRPISAVRPDAEAEPALALSA